MRLLGVEVCLYPEACVIRAEFSACGVSASLDLLKPIGWEEWAQMEKVAWVKEKIDVHLNTHTYRNADLVVFPDCAGVDMAKDKFDALVNWSSWTADEAVDWIEDNVIGFADAKALLQEMARAIVYLRDIGIER